MKFLRLELYSYCGDLITLKAESHYLGAQLLGPAYFLCRPIEFAVTVISTHYMFFTRVGDHPHYTCFMR